MAATGKVKWFSPEKGYGFILMDSATEVFVHYTSIITDGFRILHNGEQVEFELVETERGFQARDVKRLGFPDEAPDNDIEEAIPETRA